MIEYFTLIDEDRSFRRMVQSMVTERPCRVFCCSAHEDQEVLQNLKMHLKSLEREGLATIRADLDILAGAEWQQEIDRFLDMADIILLLVSPSFMASNTCFNETNKAITRHKQGKACVVPIIMRPIDWRNTAFSTLLCLPRDGKPVSLWQSTDNALFSITEEIRRLVQRSPTSIYADGAKEKPWMPPTQEDPSSTSGRDSQDKNARTYNFSGPAANVVSDSGQVQIQGDQVQRDQHIHGDQIHGGKYNFGGAVHANVIGDNTRIDTINNNIYGDQKDGIGCLGKGAKALWNGEYSSAKKELEKAVEYIDSDNQPEEASKARYLLALASLNGKLPRSQGRSGITSIEELMNSAIRLYSCVSYYRIFACIKKDLFEYTKLRNHLNEAYTFENAAASLMRRAIDDENESYFQRCEPRLSL